MTSTTYHWTNKSGGTWTDGSNWDPNNPPESDSKDPQPSELMVFNAPNGGHPYTVFMGAAVANIGGVSISSPDAVIDIADGQTLRASAAAVNSGAGGTLNMSAGELDLAGGTSQFYQTNVSGGELFGNGTVENVAVAGSILSTSGTGKVVADGGTLDIKGVGNNDKSALTVASGTHFQIDRGATLDLDGGVNLQAGATTIDFRGAHDTLSVGSATTTPGLYSAFKSDLTLNATLDNLVANPVAGKASVIDLGTQLKSVSISGNVLTAVATTGNTYNFNLGTTYGHGASASFANDGAGGTDIWIDSVCYAAGTLILTTEGEKLVEEMAEGDLVITASGEQQPVKWVGKRHLDLTRHRRPHLAAPVRIRRNAFAEGMPRRDLTVSPDHCILIEGKLIPAKLLINEMTIVQERDRTSVDYYHIELDRHAILLAEGLPAESYLDTGNRAFFSNAGLALVLHPEFHVNAGLKCWEEDACAPLAVSPSVVEPVWRSLVERAESLGYVAPRHTTTAEPDLRLVANGQTIRPIARENGRYVFALPAASADVTLRSRSTVPSYMAAYVDDWRHLGVAVRRIVVRAQDRITDIPADHPGLTRGWHQVERDDATMWRWTNGDAYLPVGQLVGPAMVEIEVGMSMTYVVEPSDQ
ncbi:MAG: Hint domain-containing protein, partial [Acetobacteraceae bacterium]|nr:Hint domain-containing protein [Acetobacteraceae bacterium]